jgi:Proteasome/cyclosome repeat
LKSVLYNDSAIAGEAAGIAMGLVMLGTASQKAIDEMLQYAHETQHEKIIRGLALGLALIMFGKEDKADAFIEQLCSDKVCGECLFCDLCVMVVLLGSYPSLWWHLCCFFGICWNWQQQGHQEATSCCCLRCE